jgi:hypothetical protein
VQQIEAAVGKGDGPSRRAIARYRVDELRFRHHHGLFGPLTFAVRRSTFAVRRSTFAVRRSTFVVLGSSFVVHEFQILNS